MYDTILISRLRFIIILMVGLSLLLLIPLLHIDQIFPKPIFVLFVIIFLLSPVIAAFRFSQYRKKILITDEAIRIDDFEIKWENIKTYKIESSSYMETITIKLKNQKRINLTGFVNGNKAKQFQWMKVKFEQKLKDFNNKVENDFKIKRTGLFESKFAKPLGFIIIGLIITGSILLLSGKMNKPQAFLIFLGVSIPVLLQIFKLKNNN